jgi:hypothetical protein
MNQKAKRQQLQREINQILERREALRTEQRDNPNAETEKELRSLRPTLTHAERALEQFESKLVLQEARRRGITVSKDTDWWSTDRGDYDNHGWEPQFVDDMTTYWLSGIGRAMVTRLIKDDRKKNIEWWVRIVGPLIAAAISLLGLVVALVTVAKK